MIGSFYRYCPYCSTPLTAFVDEGVERRRCPYCQWIQYRNPTVGVAVVLIEDDKLLLGQRRSGKWCIPCGHVEWEESIDHAAIREFREETGLSVRLTGIAAVKTNGHDPERRTVGIWFFGQRIGGDINAGDDLQTVSFFEKQGLPELEFPTDHEVICLVL